MCLREIKQKEILFPCITICIATHFGKEIFTKSIKNVSVVTPQHLQICSRYKALKSFYYRMNNNKQYRTDQIFLQKTTSAWNS